MSSREAASPSPFMPAVSCMALLALCCASVLPQGSGGSALPATIELDHTSGALTRLCQGDNEWLTGPSSFTVVDEAAAHEITFEMVGPAPVPDEKKVAFQLRSPRADAVASYEQQPNLLRVSFEVTNTSGADFGGELRWTLPLAMVGKRIFVTDQINHLSFDDIIFPRQFTYPFMAFPMWTAYHSSDGLSVVREAAELISRQVFELRPDGKLVVSATNLWLPPGKPVKTTYYLVFHAATGALPCAGSATATATGWS